MSYVKENLLSRRARFQSRTIRAFHEKAGMSQCFIGSAFSAACKVRQGARRAFDKAV